MNSFQRYSICLIMALFLMSTAGAQNRLNAAMDNYKKQADFLLQDGGKWKTENKDYNAADEWSARYFGLEFNRGIHANTLHLKISGYLPKRSEWLSLWEGFYTWDHKKKKLIYQSVSKEGALAWGQSEMISEWGMSLLLNIAYPDGKMEKLREIQDIEGSQIQSSSFIQNQQKWEAKNSMRWTRLQQPKGKLIFMSTRDGNFEVYSMDAKGDSLKNLSCNKANDYAFNCSNDGQMAFYSKRDGNDEIYIMSADGKKQTNISNHPSGDRVPYISPDGQKIVFSSNRDEKNGELYVMDSDGKNIKRLTANEYFEDAGCWSPDGKKIYFSRELRDLNDSSENAVRNMEIFVMDADGTNETRLTNKPGGDGGPQISPDGKRIAFYGRTEDGNYEIFLMEADGKNIINLTEDPMEDYSPAWSPDGKWIAYTKGNSKNYDVWLIEVETRIKWRLTNQPKRDESPFWYPFN